MKITFGSVCSGIEAASVAWHPLGWRAAWLAEIEPFPSHVLHHHYGSGRPLHMPSPDEVGLSDDDRDSRRAALKSVARLPDTVSAGAPRNLGDFTRIAAMVRAGVVAAPDVLVGGTPCQAFSIAGLRNSLDDARGQLTLAFVDLANAIDTTRIMGGKPASIVVWENVPGVLSTKDNAFGCFLGALAGEDCPLVAPGGKWQNAGCVVGPQRTIAWRVTDAQYFGVPQRRRRVFVVASARKGFDPTEILFEFDGVRRDTAPSRQAREEITGTISSRTTGGGGLGTDFELAGGLQPVQPESGHILTCVSNAEGSTGLPFLTCSNIAKTVNNQTPLLSLAERGAAQQIAGFSTSGAGYWSDGIGALRGRPQDSHENLALAPIAFDARQNTISSTEVFGALGSSSPQAQAVAFSCKDHGADATVELAPTMRAMGHQGSHANAGGQLAVCITGDITHTLKAEGFDASEDGTGRGQPIVALQNRFRGDDGRGYGRPPAVSESVVGTLDTVKQWNVTTGLAVRRLTPKECERLQAFPDFHTLIPISIVKASRAETMLAKGDPVECIDGVWWKMAADGPRYKALGNSMCTNNIAWIGRRIELVLSRGADAS